MKDEVRSGNGVIAYRKILSFPLYTRSALIIVLLQITMRTYKRNNSPFPLRTKRN